MRAPAASRVRAHRHPPGATRPAAKRAHLRRKGRFFCNRPFTLLGDAKRVDVECGMDRTSLETFSRRLSKWGTPAVATSAGDVWQKLRVTATVTPPPTPTAQQVGCGGQGSTHWTVTLNGLTAAAAHLEITQDNSLIFCRNYTREDQRPAPRANGHVAQETAAVLPGIAAVRFAIYLGFTSACTRPDADRRSFLLEPDWEDFT
jgi:hypothetical protein